MNTKLLKTLFLATLVLFASVTAQTPDQDTNTKAEENLLVGVNSDNEGLRISSAYFLGEFHLEKGVIPLMKMLRDDNNPGARLMAALSLVKIGNEQGVYMVKRTAQFNTNERVRRMSDKLYYAYLLQKYIKEHPTEAPLFAGLIK